MERGKRLQKVVTRTSVTPVSFLVVFSLLRGFLSGFPRSTKTDTSKSRFDLNVERLNTSPWLGRLGDHPLDYNYNYCCYGYGYGYCYYYLSCNIHSRNQHVRVNKKKSNCNLLKVAERHTRITTTNNLFCPGCQLSL